MNLMCNRESACRLLPFGYCTIVFIAAALPCVGADQPDLPLIPADKVHIPGVVRELAARFAEADKLAEKKRWQDAADAYLALIREHGDDLVPIPPASEPLAMGQRFVQVRRLAHQRIIDLPPAVWAAYRKRMDGVAKKWLDVALGGRDTRQLRRIANDAFISQAAVLALELLGDVAFERGDFAEARHWWRLLAPPIQWTMHGGQLTANTSTSLASSLAYPDAGAAVLARVRAKQIVTLLFQEQADCGVTELKAYRMVHGSAGGSLAGRTGKYAETVEALAKLQQGTLPTAEQEWPTFAGDPSRNLALPFALSPSLWADGPAWRVRLESGERVSDSESSKIAKPKNVARHLTCYPIISGGNAYTSDTRFMRGFELRTGKLVFQFDLLEGRNVAGSDEIRFPLTSGVDLRYTLTAADGYLCGRLGSPWFGPTREGEKRVSQSWLVCLKLPVKAGVPPKVCWAEPAAEKPGELVIFEGAPIIHHKAIYVAQSRLRGLRTSTAICCFDAETGQLRWEQDVCGAAEFVEGGPSRCRQHLLTLAGRHIVYCSHAGAIVALDATTGQRAWAVRYPSRGLKTRDGQSSPRDLCPPVAVDDRIMIAPADLDCLMCLDTMTGRSLWEQQGIDIAHLIGVSHGRVLFTTAKAIRAVDSLSGEDDGGWRQPVFGNLASRGRPFVADAWVFWPTQDTKLPWRAVNAFDGNLVRGLKSYDASLLRPLATGNAALGHGCLVIATEEELVGYVPTPGPVGPPRT